MKAHPKRWLIPLGLFAVAAFFYLTARPERLLLPMSTRVIGTGNWVGQTYNWQSGHSIIVFKEENSEFTPVVVNTYSKTVAPLISPATNGYHTYMSVSRSYISPDGSQLLWTGYVSGVEGLWTLYNLKTKVLTRCSYQQTNPSLYSDEENLVSWLPDNRRWVSLDSLAPTPCLVVYSRDGMDGSSGAYVPLMVPLPYVLPSTPSDIDPIVELLGVSQEGDALVTTWRPGPGETRSFVTCDFAPVPGAPFKKWAITLGPEVSYSSQRVLSPDKDHIAWKVVCRRSSPFLTMLGRVFSRLRSEPRETAEIWVSRLDGSGMREIGHLNLHLGPNSVGEKTPSEIRWTPDGKKLSYIYKDTLYTVPVE
jgi:hypothetical protein